MTMGELMQAQAESGHRTVLSLDGAWQFRHESDTQWRTAQVPGPWQAQFADLRNSSRRATYRRSFPRPHGLAGREAVLRFGAVSYFAEVHLNGTMIGAHEGGYLPFECAVPPGLIADTNDIEVLCLLPDGDPATAPDFPFAEIPHGKQSWYGPLGGIWQSVALELRDPAHLVHCAITADRTTGVVMAALTLSPASAGAMVHVTVTDPMGGVAATLSVPTGQSIETLRLTVADAMEWSPDGPNLYSATVEILRGGVLDRTCHTFGFRSIETRNGQILLNGQPFYMRAALDQDYYPEGICTPPSVEFLEDQLHKARALGLNMLRCHIKVPDPRYYEVADRLGMLIWTEIPNVAFFTDASARRMRETMEGILARDGNHPSIVIWTLINEDWGTRLCEDASHRQWLKNTYDWLKAKDPTRLVVDNSPCHGNFHVKTDLNDFHYYRSVPERRSEWDALTAEFAAGADWTYTPFGDGERRGDEPLIVSEFGVWGLPDPKKITIGGAEPWWMETGAAWGDGAAYPHDIQGRFDALRLDTVFGGFDTFIEHVQWYQFSNLKYEIEVMRAHAPITGYVVTEFTDVHWEANGLLDMNRNPRIFHDRFVQINADVVIVPKVERYSGTAGQPFRFGLAVATGGLALAHAELRWKTETGQGGTLPVPASGALHVADLGTIEMTLPDVPQNRMLCFELTLMRAGQELARNQFDIGLYAERRFMSLPTVATDDAELAAHARALGYAVVPRDRADVVLLHALDALDIAQLQGGARFVVLADGTEKTRGNLRKDAGRREQPFMPIVDETPGLSANSESQLPNINLIARHGAMWRGDWIAGFSWIRRESVFADMPGGPLVDLSFDRVIPHHVMTGFRTWEYGGPVHSGVVVGWVHKPAALIAERIVGRGRLVASTFRLLSDAPGEDPVAAFLFDALIRLAASHPTTG
jgi:hypothetical protein